MNVSEDMSHPGYWGGVVLVGRDVFIDVRTVRKNALEHTVNEVTQLTRNSLSFENNKMTIDGNNRLFIYNVWIYSLRLSLKQFIS